MVLNWRASHSGAKDGASNHMDGVFKLYNVGQDTKFEPGGDKETSYMYEMGRPNPHPSHSPNL